MSVVSITAWLCDFSACGHVWYTAKEPARCAKCKRKNWNKTAGTVIKPPRSRKKPVGKGTAKPETSQVDKSAPLDILTFQSDGTPVIYTEEQRDRDKGREPITIDKPLPPVLETIVHAPIAERFQEALKQIAEPEHKIGEKCKHGWANWLQCEKCNPKLGDQ